MSEKAIFEEPKQKPLTTDQIRRTFSTSQQGVLPVRVVPKKSILSELDDTTPPRETQKKFSISAELQKNPGVANSKLLEKDDDENRVKKRKHHHSDDSDDSEIDENNPKKVSKLTANSRMAADDKFKNPIHGEKEQPEQELDKEKAVQHAVNRNKSAMKEKKAKRQLDESSDDEDSDMQEKEFEPDAKLDTNVFFSKKRKEVAEGVKRLIKEKPAHAEEKKKEDFNLEDGYVSDAKSDDEEEDGDDDSDNSDDMVDDEADYEQEDEFGEMKEIDDCRACKEAFGTGRNREKIDEYIDRVLASASNSLSLDSIITIIYKHVEVKRRKHNQSVTDPREHIDVWPKNMIKKHLTEHMVRLDMQIKAQHEFNKRAEKLILQQIKGVDPENGSVVLNYKAIDALLKVQKAIKDNTRLNPEASYTYVSDQIPKRTRVKRVLDGIADP
jgi:hypothetical protein